MTDIIRLSRGLLSRRSGVRIPAGAPTYGRVVFTWSLHGGPTGALAELVAEGRGEQLATTGGGL